jgi:hypothetical protein
MSGDALPALTDFHWALRTEIYACLAATTDAPNPDELAAWAGRPRAEIVAALDALEAHHHLALLPDRSGVWMAHPFSAVPTAYPVETERGRYWANCAWDALGICAILDTDGWTKTRCSASGTPLEFGVENGVRAGDEGVIHLVVPPRNAWDDIGFT